MLTDFLCFVLGGGGGSSNASNGTGPELEDVGGGGGSGTLDRKKASVYVKNQSKVQKGGGSGG